MQSVLDKLNDAHEEIQKIEKEARERLADVLVRENRVILREKKVAEDEATMGDREAAVSKIESVVALKKEAEELMAKAQALMESATGAQKELDKNTKISTDTINDLRSIARKEQDNVDKRRRELDDEVSKRVEQCLINMGIRKG